MNTKQIADENLETLSSLVEHAKDDLRLAELKAVEIAYFHTAEDCKNARKLLEHIIKSREGGGGMKENTQPKQVRVADLQDQIGTPYPRALLFCECCGSEYSAHRGDYWNFPKTHVLTCCGAPMVLAIKKKTYQLV
jgi:hypothetical protein